MRRKNIAPRYSLINCGHDHGSERENVVNARIDTIRLDFGGRGPNVNKTKITLTEFKTGTRRAWATEPVPTTQYIAKSLAKEDAAKAEIYWAHTTVGDSVSNDLEDEKSSDFFAYWEIQGYDEFLGDCIEIRNAIYRKHLPYVIKASCMDNRYCAGIGYGQDCPYDTVICQRTALYTGASNPNHSGEAWLEKNCFLCDRLYGRMLRKGLKERLDNNGQPLCAISNVCPNVRASKSLLCDAHLKRERERVDKRPWRCLSCFGSGSSLISSRKQLVNHLRTCEPQTHPAWNEICRLHLDGELTYVDVEFAGPITTQIACRHSQTGALLFCWVVNHGKTYEELLAELPESHTYQRKAITKFYGPEADKTAPTATLEQIAHEFRRHGIRKMAEWTIAYNDIDHVEPLLRPFVHICYVPTRNDSIRALIEMRSAFQLRNKCLLKLSPFHKLICPDTNAGKAHTADVDTLMLWEATDYLIRGKYKESGGK